MGIDLLSADRAHDVRPEGRRRALRAPQGPARAHRADDGRRRPRARHALGHGAGAACRSDSAGRRRSPRGDARGEQAARGPARPAAGAHRGEGGRGVRERQRRTASAAQLEHLVRVRGRRVGADGAQQGSRPVVGLGLHVGDARAVLRHLRARRRRRAGPLLDPLRSPPVQHGGRGRVRGRSARSRWCCGCARCRRCTSWRRKAWIFGRSTGRRNSGAPGAARRQSDHGIQRQGDRSLHRTRATSGPSPRTRRAWARGWSAHPSAATS